MIKRIYDSMIVNTFPLFIIEKLIDNDPLISQSSDVGIKNKGIVELKFSLN